MIWADSDLWKRRLHPLQMEQEDVILRRSSTENGKFYFSQMQSFKKFLDDTKIYEVHKMMMMS